MSGLDANVVVKDEVPDITEEEEDQTFELDLHVNEDIKRENDVSDGRRRSRRLQQNPSIAPKVVKHVREDMEEKYKEKLKRKYARKKQRLAKLSEEEKMIRKEKARISYQARREKQKEMGTVPKKYPGKVKPNKPTSNKPKKPTSESQKERSKFLRILKEAQMTEEELEQLRAKRFMQRHAFIASKTKEELEALKARKKQRYQENKEHCIERQRQWRASLTGEKKERYLASVYKAIKKHYEKMKSQRDERTGTDKYREWAAKNVAKQKQKFATESPEARQKRLLSYKINQARRKLRQRLEKEGVPSEIIEKRVEELVMEMKSRPMPPPSEYKPREKLNENAGDDPVVRKRRNRRPQTKVNEGGPSSCDSSSGGGGYDGAAADLHGYQHFMTDVPANVKKKNDDISRCDWQLNNATTFSFQMVPILPIVSVSTVTTSQQVFASSLPSANVSTNFFQRVSSDDFQETRRITDISNDFSPSCSPLDSSHDHYDSIPAPEPQPLPQEQKISLSIIHPSVSCRTSAVLSSSPPTTVLTPPAKSATPPPSAIFKCPQCPEVLSTNKSLRNHLGTSHPFTCWKCPKCYEVMLSPAELSDHFKIHLQSSSSTYPKISNASNTTFGDLIKTEFKGRRRKTLNFICMKCPFKSSPSMSSSVKNRFQTLNQLSAHVQRRHPTSFWPCPNCKVLKYSKDRLEFHKKSCLEATAIPSSSNQRNQKKKSLIKEKVVSRRGRQKK